MAPHLRLLNDLFEVDMCDTLGKAPGRIAREETPNVLAIHSPDALS